MAHFFVSSRQKFTVIMSNFLNKKTPARFSESEFLGYIIKLFYYGIKP